MYYPYIIRRHTTQDGVVFTGSTPVLKGTSVEVDGVEAFIRLRLTALIRHRIKEAARNGEFVLPKLGSGVGVKTDLHEVAKVILSTASSKLQKLFH